MKREYAAPLDSEIRLVIEKLDHHQKGVLLDGSSGDVRELEDCDLGYWGSIMRSGSCRWWKR